MNIWVLLGECAFGALVLFFLLFCFFSFLEREWRAFKKSLFFLLGLIAGNALFFLLPIPSRSWIFGILFGFAVACALFFLGAPKPKHEIDVGKNQRRIDERDVIFARFDLKEGTQHFQEYYERHPEYRPMDDEIRKLPDILTVAQMKEDPLLLSLASAEFDFLEQQLGHVAGNTAPEKAGLPPEENSRLIKKVMNYLGADICGICSLNRAYVYSHVGRGPEPYGQEIKLDHKHAIVFAVEMDASMISAAPQAPVIVETGSKYVKAAEISITAAHFIRRLGYPARAHIAGSNYQAVLPPLGWEAGLGELGRLGILITDQYGPRVRLGLVTTDLPLIQDQPRNFGVQDFCEKCQKCAINCPAQAIPNGEKKRENDVLKWVLDREACYRFWRKAGTDCAVCIFVCPFSKPDNAFHKIIRRAASKSSFFQSLSIWADDFFYGRSGLRKKAPLDP